MWRWCRITLPPLWFTLNQNALRPCRSRLRLLTAAVRRAPCSRVSGNVLSGGWAAAAVGLHPMRDRVASFGWPVVVVVELPRERVEELLSLPSVTARAGPPGGGRDQLRDVDRFGVDGGENPGRAELGLRQQRDQVLAAVRPPLPDQDPRPYPVVHRCPQIRNPVRIASNAAAVP